MISATATDGANNTSEFSACIPVGPVPALAVSPATGNQVRLTWTNTATGFVLKQTDSLSPPVQWTNVSTSPIVSNGQFVVTVPAVRLDAITRYVLSKVMGQTLLHRLDLTGGQNRSIRAWPRIVSRALLCGVMALAVAIATDAVAQPSMQTILTNGPASNRLNIVVLAEGLHQQPACSVSRGRNQCGQDTAVAFALSGISRAMSTRSPFKWPPPDSGSDHPAFSTYKQYIFQQ